jgi:alanyl-tRNA synthetase
MMVTKDLVDKGIKANDLIKEIASFIEGSGGGKPDVAQAGGKKAEKIKDALQAVEQVIKTSLSKIKKDA